MSKFVNTSVGLTRSVGCFVNFYLPTPQVKMGSRTSTDSAYRDNTIRVSYVVRKKAKYPLSFQQCVETALALKLPAALTKSMGYPAISLTKSECDSQSDNRLFKHSKSLLNVLHISM